MAKNLTELRSDLSELFNQIKQDKIELDKAKELNNTAGKIINATKAQLIYLEMRKEKPEIPFCE